MKKIYYRVTPILMVLLMALYITGCGGGDNSVTGPDDNDKIETPPTNAPTTVSSRFTDEETAFLPGEIRLIMVEGLELSEEEYEGQLSGGAEVILPAYHKGEEEFLVFVVPEESSGDHELQFTLNEQEQSLSFTIRTYQQIEDPGAFTHHLIDSLYTGLQGMVNQVEDPVFRKKLEAAQDSLQKKKGQLDDLSEAQMKQLARILDSYFITGGTLSEASQSALMADQVFRAKTTECSDSFKPMLNNALGAAVSLYGLSLSGTVATTGWGAVVGGITGAVSFGALYISLEGLKTKLITYWDTCIYETVKGELDGLIEDNALKGKQKSTFNFEHGIPRSYSVVAQYEAPDELQKALDKVKSLMDYALDLIPEEWVEPIMHEYVVERVEDPAAYGIRKISDDTIEPSVAVEGDQLSMSFSYRKEVILDGNPAFTFEVYDTREAGQVLTMDAVLTPPDPVAYGLSVRTDFNKTVEGTLKGDFAAGYSVEEEPEHGAVSLDERQGTFTYDPEEGYSGSDRFTYTVENSKGVSNAAEVTITVEAADDVIPASLRGEWIYNGNGMSLILGVQAKEIYAFVNESPESETCYIPTDDWDIAPGFSTDVNGVSFTYTANKNPEPQIQDDVSRITLSLYGSSLQVDVTNIFGGDGGSYTRYFNRVGPTWLVCPGY